MNTYESAPGTQLLATACACCRRPLLDALSVETGMGPICRRKHGFGEQAAPANWSVVATALAGIGGASVVDALGAQDAHKLANVLVHQIACEQVGPGVARRVAALDALGFNKLARILATRLGAVEVALEGDLFTVKTPRGLDPIAFEAFGVALRSVPGTGWDGARKVRTVPVTAKRALWDALRRALPGGVVVGARVAAL
jgi:hypothetical protein